LKQSSRFSRKKEISNEIPTGPMADISFLLIIFFMVTTVFVVYRGFPVDLPFARSIDTFQGKRNAVNIWVSSQGNIMVDDHETTLNEVGNIIGGKLAMNPRIVVYVKADRNTRYQMVSGVIQELRKAKALRVSFIAKKE
jgi:biopolymer transport protein ExbD